jgi:acetyltransferase-like isoleucine patch superfamily enzyme
MAHEFGAQRFFDPEGLPGIGVFVPGEPVWTALDRLGDLLKAHLTSCTAGLPRLGSRVTEDAALLPDGTVVTGNLSVSSWDAAKGKLSVRCGDELLDDAALICGGSFIVGDAVEIGPGALVEPGAHIRGPVILGPASEVRQAAYVRGSVLLGRGSVVGHATEVKNSVFLDGAKAPHFAYVGDSLLGRGVNLGAGTKLANLKIIPGTVRFAAGAARVDTGRRKFGAVLGDGTEIGCNAVTAPGVLMERGCRVFPAVSVAPGLYAERTTVRPRR